MIPGIDRTQPRTDMLNGVCKLSYHVVSPCGRFTWPRKAAQLQDMVCPTCGKWLRQTMEGSQGRWTTLSADEAKALAAPARARREHIAKAVKRAVAEFDASNPRPEREYETRTYVAADRGGNKIEHEYTYPTNASDERVYEWAGRRGKVREQARRDADRAFTHSVVA